MVRQIMLEFLHQRRGEDMVPEPSENALALAFIIAESNRKSKAKIKYLTPIAIPFWSVQVSDTHSILLSGIGESSIAIELSEETALGPVRRALTSETKEVSNIPSAVDQIIPMLKDIEFKTHQVKNLQEPEVIVKLGSIFEALDPNTRPVTLPLKIDSSEALKVSEEFQCIVSDAKTRLSNMEAFRKLVKEQLADRLKVLDNLAQSELARMERQLKTLEQNTEARIAKLEERRSDIIYRLRDKRKKDQSAIIAQFARDTTELERFFGQILEEIKKFRAEIRAEGTSLQDAVLKYQMLVDDLAMTVPRFTDVTDTVGEIAQQLIAKSDDLDEDLQQKIAEEEASIDEQIDRLKRNIVDYQDEIKEKEKEFAKLKKAVGDSVNRMEQLANKRVDEMTSELRRVTELTFQSDRVNDLTPLSLLYINTFVVTYNKGAPLVIAPTVVPTNRFGIPLKAEPLDANLEKFIQKSIKSLMKSSPSFKEGFEKVRAEGNVFYNPETISQFQTGISNLWNRQLLNEGVKETLESEFIKLVGKCPSCKAELGKASKFCPECGVALA